MEILQEVPFNITQFENKQYNEELKQFQELYKK